MSTEIGISLAELLAWNDEAAHNWKSHLETNPALLEVACDIGGVANVQQFVRHIWGVELRWAQRLAGLPVSPNEEMPGGPLEALFGLHIKAVKEYRTLLDDPVVNWDEKMTLDFSWLPPEARTVSRRKIAAHALFHSHRHYAQLATLTRTAGFPAQFRGDLLFSSALG